METEPATPPAAGDGSDADAALTIEFVLTLQEWRRARTAMMRIIQPRLNSRFNRVFPWVLGAILLVVLASRVAAVASGGGIGWGEDGLVAAMVILLVGGRLMMHLLMGAGFSRLPLANKPVRWRISPDRLEARSANGTATLEWRAIIGVRESKHGFVLLTNPQLGEWLPRAAFAAEAERERLRGWVRAHGIELKRI